MDQLGPDGCREERAWLKEQLRASAELLDWASTIAAAATAVSLKLWINPFDRYGGLIDEAIRRAEEKLIAAESSK